MTKSKQDPQIPQVFIFGSYRALVRSINIPDGLHHQDYHYQVNEWYQNVLSFIESIHETYQNTE